MRAISIAIFETTEEFEAWQLERFDIASIISVQTVPISISGSTNEHSVLATMKFAIIVQYFKEIPH